MIQSGWRPTNSAMRLFSPIGFSFWLLLASVSAFAQTPEMVVQTGHSGDIRSVAFSRDGKTFVPAADCGRCWREEIGFLNYRHSKIPLCS
jgi:hypothetical protein